MKNYFLKIIILLLIYVFDLIIWLLIKSLPGPLTLKILKKRRNLVFHLKFQENIQIKIRNLILRFINKKSNRKIFLSSCLSRAVTCSILLQFIGIKTDINLGINKNKNGEIVPHAWISSFDDNDYFTMLSRVSNTTKLYNF